MNKDFKGTVVEESLEDSRILNRIKILSCHITEEDNPANRWHIYTVIVTKDDIMKISKYIKSGKWYMHFWNKNDVIAVFKDKIFEFKLDEKSTWKDAHDYGISLGIPEEQLDFIIE